MSFSGLRTTTPFLLKEYVIDKVAGWFGKEREVIRYTGESRYDSDVDRIAVIGNIEDWQEVAFITIQLETYAKEKGVEIPKGLEMLNFILSGLSINKTELNKRSK